MYRLKSMSATNVTGFMSGLGRKTFRIDFSEALEAGKSIFLACGANASGKSTFLSLIHPTHIPSDGRTKFIVPGKEGSLIREYIGDDGTILLSKCIATPKEDTHLWKCYLSIRKPGDTEAIELNPNGNVTSYYALLDTYFGITKDFVNFASYNDAVEGMVTMTDMERKQSVANLVPNTERFEVAYGIINERHKELRNLMRNVSQKIMNIRDADSLDADLSRVNAQLTKAHERQDELNEKIGRADGRIRELSGGKDIKAMAQAYNDMVMGIANMDSELGSMRNRLLHIYAQLGLELDEKTPVSFVGEDKLNAQISRLERKLASVETTIRISSERREKILADISKTEKEIAESESVLFGLQTQDVAELEKTRDEYKKQLREMRYTGNEKKYEGMSYSECIRMSELCSSMIQLIEALYEEHGELITEYFRNIHNLDEFRNGCQHNVDMLSVELESRSAKRDSLYRQIIEKEQYSKFQDILTQRPRNCTIDNCPFIANALKWSHVAGELKDLQAQYDKLNVEIEQASASQDSYRRQLMMDEHLAPFMTLLRSSEDGLRRYLGLGLDDVYHAIVTGSWLTVLDIMKLKSLAAILSEKDYHDRIVNNLLPDIEHAIEMAKVYGTNRAILESQISKLVETRDLMMSELDESTISQTASSRMRSIYALQLERYREIRSLLDDYNELARKRIETFNDAKSKESNITRITELVKKANSMNEELREVHNSIEELEPLKDQLEFDMKELIKLKGEKEQIDEDFLVVDIMRSIVQPGKGIRKELLNMYFYDIYQTANELLMNTFDGKLRLHEFIITDKEFTIPFEYAGETGSDISFASSSQRATIAIAISMAIISKLIDRYSILTFDESDQTMSPANKAVFIDILTKQMRQLGVAQTFMISHSPEFYSSIDNVQFIGFPGYEDFINTKENDVIEI